MSALTGSRISGLGGYRPRRTVGNEEIAERAPVTVEWIETRTGIRTRGHAGEDESIVDMGEHASRAALRDAGLTPDDIDLVIVATQTMLKPIPSGAPELANRLGCHSAGAYDLNAACAGLTYGIAAASDAVRLGNARHVLVAGSERLTDWTTPQIPDVYALLADGAGAVVVSPSERQDIGPAVWGSAGEHREALWVPDGGEHIAMKGRQVFKWTLDHMPAAAQRACRLAGVELSDIAWLVLHQANRRMLDAIGTELKFEPDQIVCDVADGGNTSTASIPLALCRLREEGRVRPGDRALFLGFGAGLTYAGQVVTLS